MTEAIPRRARERPRVPRALLGVGIAAIAFAAVSAGFAIHYASSTGGPSTSQALNEIGASGQPAPGFASLHRAAPAFSLPGLATTTAVGPSRLKGPVLVNFWSSTCVPCREEMPLLASAATELSGRVAVLGVDTDDGRAQARAFAASHAARYPIGYDPNESVGDAFGLSALPTTYFLSADHKTILGVYFGAMTRAGLHSALERVYGITL